MNKSILTSTIGIFFLLTFFLLNVNIIKADTGSGTQTINLIFTHDNSSNCNLNYNGVNYNCSMSNNVSFVVDYNYTFTSQITVNNQTSLNVIDVSQFTNATCSEASSDEEAWLAFNFPNLALSSVTNPILAAIQTQNQQLQQTQNYKDELQTMNNSLVQCTALLSSANYKEGLASQNNKEYAILFTVIIGILGLGLMYLGLRTYQGRKETTPFSSMPMMVKDYKQMTGQYGQQTSPTIPQSNQPPQNLGGIM